MRKITYITILAILFVNSSCSNDDFANSAATRIQVELKNSGTALCEAENGWLMQYYATPESPGYSMLLKFEPSELVTVAGKSELTGNTYLEAKSLYALVADYGPVLSFDTYNDVLHAFSDPAYPQGSGLMGDYEFIIRQRLETSFEMIGKKRGTRILMEKLPADVSWKDYFEQLDEMEYTMFGERPPVLTLSLGSAHYSFSEGTSRIFKISGTDIPAESLLKIPFIITKYGVSLYQPIVLAGRTFQKFELNEDSSALVSMEDPDVKLIGVTDLTGYYFTEAIKTTTTWYIDRDNSSADVQALYDNVEAGIKAFYGSSVSNIYLSINRVTTNQIGLILRFTLGTSSSSAGYYCNWTRVSDTEAILVHNGNSDRNGEQLYTRIAGISELVGFLSEQHSYLLSTATSLNPIKIKFTQQDNPSSWIMLSL